jgi:hypothetical protein
MGELHRVLQLVFRTAAQAGGGDAVSLRRANVTQLNIPAASADRWAEEGNS